MKVVVATVDAVVCEVGDALELGDEVDLSERKMRKAYFSFKREYSIKYNQNTEN